MNFLQIAKLLAREVDIAGTGPLSVLNQTGEFGNIVEWAREAYVDIQRSRGSRWRWLRREFTFNTTASDGVYAYGDVTDVVASAVINRFDSWDLKDPYDPPKIYLTASGISAQRWLSPLSWEAFKSLYRIGNGNTMTGAPVHISVDDADQIVLGPIPSDTYTITGRYKRGPQVLTTDADIPEMPEHFHKLIVWNAMLDYGYHQASAESLARAQVRGKPLMRQLENRQLPAMRLSRALA